MNEFKDNEVFIILRLFGAGKSSTDVFQNPSGRRFVPPASE